MDERRGKESQDSGMQTNESSESIRITQEQRRTKENVPPEEQQQIDPNPDEPASEPSGFMKIIGKVGYSVWLIVMVVGGVLAFVAALFLI